MLILLRRLLHRTPGLYGDFFGAEEGLQGWPELGLKHTRQNVREAERKRLHSSALVSANCDSTSVRLSFDDTLLAGSKRCQSQIEIFLCEAARSPHTEHARAA